MNSKLTTVIKRVTSKVDNDEFAAAPRPHDPVDYERPELDGFGPPASEIPLDGTMPGASLDIWPPRTLDGCREPLAPGAPDLRGVWEVVEGRMKGHVERIEQAGNRITITTGGLVHDMFCDGTPEDGVHKLRPFGKKIVAVTRRLDGDEMIWRYGPYRNRLRRLLAPPFDHPATRAVAQAAGTLPD